MRQPLSVRDAMALVRDHVDGQVSVYALMAAGALRFEHLLPIGPDIILEWGDGDAERDEAVRRSKYMIVADRLVYPISNEAWRDLATRTQLDPSDSRANPSRLRAP